MPAAAPSSCYVGLSPWLVSLYRSLWPSGPPCLQCGHEAPAGFGGSDEEREEGAPQQVQPGPPRSHKRSREDEEEEQQAAEQAADKTIAAQSTAAAAGGTQQHPPPPAAAAGHPHAAAQGWRPQADLPRERKIAVGQLCKRLIDAARLRWLRRQGFEAALVKYVPSSVSGENRLLVAAVPPADAGAA